MDTVTTPPSPKQLKRRLKWQLRTLRLGRQSAKLSKPKGVLDAAATHRLAAKTDDLENAIRSLNETIEHSDANGRRSSKAPAATALLGAAAVWFLDPASGSRRREMARNGARRLARIAGRTPALGA